MSTFYCQFPLRCNEKFLLCLTSSLVYIRNIKFAIILSTRGPLRFENNPSFLRKIPTTCGDQKADRCPGIYPGSGEIPVRKPYDLCLPVHKININLTPLAVAVCLMQVWMSGWKNIPFILLPMNRRRKIRWQWRWKQFGHSLQDCSFSRIPFASIWKRVFTLLTCSPKETPLCRRRAGNCKSQKQTFFVNRVKAIKKISLHADYPNHAAYFGQLSFLVPC